MSRMVMAGLVVLAVTACSSEGDEPSDEITRIDGPAVVDEDEGGADNGATDDPSDG